jgi:hypothetical protein
MIFVNSVFKPNFGLGKMQNLQGSLQFGYVFPDPLCVCCPANSMGRQILRRKANGSREISLRIVNKLFLLNMVLALLKGRLAFDGNSRICGGLFDPWFHEVPKDSA